MEKSFVVFKTYSFTHQAELDLQKLKSEGIKAYLSDENMGSFSFLGAATGGVKIHILEEDLKRAQEILPDEPTQPGDE
jgi:hypothetical protein